MKPAIRNSITAGWKLVESFTRLRCRLNFPDERMFVFLWEPTLDGVYHTVNISVFLPVLFVCVVCLFCFVYFSFLIGLSGRQPVSAVARGSWVIRTRSVSARWRVFRRLSVCLLSQP